jgi:hypothetical protein
MEIQNRIGTLCGFKLLAICYEVAALPVQFWNLIWIHDAKDEASSLPNKTFLQP